MPIVENPPPYGSSWDKPFELMAHDPATHNYPRNPSSNQKAHGEPDQTAFDKDEQPGISERKFPGGYLVEEDLRHNRYSALKFLASQEGRARLQIQVPEIVDQAYSRVVKAFKPYRWLTLEKCNGATVVVKGILDSYSGEWFGDLKFYLDLSIPILESRRGVELVVPVEVRRREASWKAEDKFEAHLVNSLGQRFEFGEDGLKMIMDYDPEKYKSLNKMYL